MADEKILMTIPRLLEAVHGRCLCNYSPIDGFISVATDSRQAGPKSLFIPLIGEFQDGHLYIEKAMENGASVLFVDELHAENFASTYEALGLKYGCTVIVVQNTLLALQDAARAYVSFFPRLLKIGVTGSSGKTTTKEILGSIFSQKYSVIMNEGNLNSETGLPLSVFRIREGHEVGIFELGMNRRGEIAEIAKVLSPSLALITNIGTAHIGILGTQQAIAEEKKQIFSFFDKNCTGFVPEDDSWREFISNVPEGTIRLFGKSSTDGFEGAENLGIDGSLIRYKGQEIHFPLPGKYNLSNALGAIGLASSAGLDVYAIKKGLESVKPLFGRAQVIRGPVTVIMDCYNANPDSMESALDFCSSLEWQGNKIFVLGSMLELGAESVEAHRSVCALAARSGAEYVFLFGSEMIAAGKSIDWGKVNISFSDDIDQLSKALTAIVKSGDLVFIKGSRGMALERVMPAVTGENSGGVFHV